MGGRKFAQCLPSAIKRRFRSFEGFYEVPRAGPRRGLKLRAPLRGKAGAQAGRYPPRATGDSLRSLPGPPPANPPHRAGRSQPPPCDPRPRVPPLRRRARFPGDAFLAAPRAARTSLAEHLPADPARSSELGCGPAATQVWRPQDAVRAQEPHPAGPRPHPRSSRPPRLAPGSEGRSCVGRSLSLARALRWPGSAQVGSLRI